jgi:hypothetical protein
MKVAEEIREPVRKIQETHMGLKLYMTYQLVS